ncbi:MAG: sialidase family protein [Acidobacteriota bacterium]
MDTKLSRRTFLTAPAAPVVIRWARASSSGLLEGVEHVKLHGNHGTYCGHPRQGGLFNFGSGEIAVLHYHAPCAYQRPEDVKHDFGGYHSRSVVLLQRSTDGGRNWPEENNVVVWNEAATLEHRLKMALSCFTSPRAKIDLFSPKAALWMGRTFLGPNRFGAFQMIAFSLRSGDKGASWEEVPSLISPPPGSFGSSADNAPMVYLPEQTLLFPMRSFGGRRGTSLYGSTDNGLSWHFRTHISDTPDYPALVLLKSGRLQCYTYPMGMHYSDDLGKTWSERRSILPSGPSPWAANDPVYNEPLAHRSPMPLLLRDGRILILFARRISPGLGMGLTVSEDGGRTWSRDCVLRNDASPSEKVQVSGTSHDYSDIGYPVATELEDGRIFTAYYFMTHDGNGFGGSRFLAGSFFKVT